jgi:tetratricopeptide (TPR) repeat protein
MADSSLGKLQRALRRFPRDRYPVKHASIQRQIGLALVSNGELVDAEAAFRLALEIYDEELPVERGDTLNVLGAVLRDSGRLEEAAETFREATTLLAPAKQVAESGIAHYNLGLVLKDLGNESGASAAFERAVASLEPQSHPSELGAALRELASTLLTSGKVEEASSVLERSLDLAAGGGDRAGLGASANLLGLARLALGDGEGATESFAESASANALTLRPDGHAMAKANLALAYEATGQLDRARLSAQQALSVDAAPPIVTQQAQAILERLGPDYDLHVVLDDEPAAGWGGILRDEIRHWARLDEARRRELAISWVAGQVSRPESAVDRLEALFNAMLELSLDGFDLVAGALVEAAISAGEEASAEFHKRSSQAAAHFRVPQMTRIEAALRPTAERRPMS